MIAGSIMYSSSLTIHQVGSVAESWTNEVEMHKTVRKEERARWRSAQDDQLLMCPRMAVQRKCRGAILYAAGRFGAFQKSRRRMRDPSEGPVGVTA